MSAVNRLQYSMRSNLYATSVIQISVFWLGSRKRLDNQYMISTKPKPTLRKRMPHSRYTNGCIRGGQCSPWEKIETSFRRGERTIFSEIQWIRVIAVGEKMISNSWTVRYVSVGPLEERQRLWSILLVTGFQFSWHRQRTALRKRVSVITLTDWKRRRKRKVFLNVCAGEIMKKKVEIRVWHGLAEGNLAEVSSGDQLIITNAER